MPYPDSEYPSILRGRDKRESQRLLAAAPELLKACRLVAECLGDWIQVADRDADTSEDERRLAIAYAAIAKAEGRGE